MTIPETPDAGPPVLRDDTPAGTPTDLIFPLLPTLLSLSHGLQRGSLRFGDLRGNVLLNPGLDEGGISIG